MYPHSHPAIAGALARDRASALAEEASSRAFAEGEYGNRRLRARRITQSVLVLATVIVALVAAVPGVAGAATVYGGNSAGDVPFALQVSADHTRLVRALVRAEATVLRRLAAAVERPDQVRPQAALSDWGGGESARVQRAAKERQPRDHRTLRRGLRGLRR
jgi:hypothetical protein